MYGYAILLFYEYYMRHGPRLTCVDHPTDPCMTSNYTPDMLKCYLSFQTQEIEPCTSSVVERSNDDDTWINMLPTFHEHYMTYGTRLIGVNHLTDHSMTSNYTLDMLRCYP